MIHTDFCGRCRRDCGGVECYYTSVAFLIFVMNADIGYVPEAEPTQNIHDTYLGEMEEATA